MDTRGTFLLGVRGVWQASTRLRRANGLPMRGTRALCHPELFVSSTPTPSFFSFPPPLTPPPEEEGNASVCCMFIALQYSPSSLGGRGRGMEEEASEEGAGGIEKNLCPLLPARQILFLLGCECIDGNAHRF